MTNRLFPMMLIAWLTALAAWPCGYSGPSDFFVLGGRALHRLPEPIFNNESGFILGPPPEQREPYHPEYRFGWERIADVYIAEVQQFLAGAGDADALEKQYRRLRRSLHHYTLDIRDAKRTARDSNQAYVAPPPFDLGPYHDLLEALPGEFGVYLQGAAAYHSGQLEDARRHFSAVLALDPDQRRHRSVWAAFMLGKTLLASEQPEPAVPFFEMTRDLVREGFPDSLALAADSLNWQGRALYLAGRYREALHAYLEYRNVSGEWESTNNSLVRVFRRLFSEEEIPRGVVHDDVARELITAWLISGRAQWDRGAGRWLLACDELPKEGVVAGADRLAWLAYQRGDMEGAERWLNQGCADTKHARYVRGYLLLRQGELASGAALLDELGQSDETSLWQFWDTYIDTPASDVAYAELAGNYLRNNLYSEALKHFLLAGFWGDAAFVAERILTIDELAAFVKEHKQKPYEAGDDIGRYVRHAGAKGLPQYIPRVAYVLARRLARAGRWDEAIPYYPEKRIFAKYYQTRSEMGEVPTLPEVARAFAAHLSSAEEAANPARQRAEHYFEAGKLMREYGMDLVGAELAPDGALYGGAFPFDQESLVRYGREILTEESLARIAASAIVPDKRFHFRYLAADLMKQCADLLPNNDALTAEALYLGGTYLKLRDPQAADPFYKALVRRNPNLLIARQADELRWFPREFTDVVLYQPLDRRFPFRKRTMAMVLFFAGMSFLVLFGVAARAGMRRRPQK